MTKKIFRSILFTSLAVLLIGMATAVGFLYYYFTNVQSRELGSELSLAVSGVETGGVDYLTSLERKNGIRLTLVGSDGMVIYDTDADAGTMENHSDREEIREAMETGAGESFRYSATLTEKTIYRTQRLSTGSVLRISVSKKTVLSLIAGITPWFVLASVVAFLLSWILAKQLSRRIITPLNRINLERPLENDAYDELSPLLSRIQKQHEQIDEQLLQLKQKTDEFEYITSNMKEGLILLDKSGKILSINPYAAGLFRVDSKTAAGVDFLTVERSPELDHAITTASESGHSEIRQTRDGRSYQFDISRIESGGAAMGLVILVFDVSEEEYAEETRREFSANVSHELKTPLTSIIASAELIENNLVKPEDMPRFIGHIHKEASRLLSLIEDVIRLSQLDEGAEMPAEEVDLSAVARDVAVQLGDNAEKNNVTLITTCPTPCILTGVPRLLHEIVYNLTDNAIKYNIPGGKVEVSVRKTDNTVELKVADTGIGIPPEHQPRVFERFYRVDKSHSKASGGTGLGLSIVKHAAAYFGADITLTSETGKGTIVTVTFPM